MKRFSAVVSDEEYMRAERLVRAGTAGSIAELVRRAVKAYTDSLGAGKLLNLREIPLEQARREVEGYLKSHLGVVWPDEMAEELGVDYRVILAVVRELSVEGKIEEAEARAEVARV